jgi:hypothetical protein
VSPYRVDSCRAAIVFQVAAEPAVPWLLPFYMGNPRLVRASLFWWAVRHCILACCLTHSAVNLSGDLEP